MSATIKRYAPSRPAEPNRLTMVGCRVPHEEACAWWTMAAERGMTASALFRDAMRAWVEAQTASAAEDAVPAALNTSPEQAESVAPG